MAQTDTVPYPFGTREWRRLEHLCLDFGSKTMMAISPCYIVIIFDLAATFA
jgi:hypothetical protein